MEEDQEYTLQGVGERSSSLEGEELGGDYECELMIEALRRELDIVRVSPTRPHLLQIHNIMHSQPFELH